MRETTGVTAVLDASAMDVLADEAARLSELRGLNLIDTGREERFDRITRLAAQLFDVENAAITLVDSDVLHVKSDLWGSGDCRRGDSFCSLAIEGTGVLVVRDATRDDRFSDSPLVTSPQSVRFYAGQPLMTPNGHAIGVLCLIDGAAREFSDREASVLAQLGALVERELAHDADLERAAAVQRGLFPRRRPDLEGWDVAGTCVPARVIGGDLYDWYPIAGGEALTVADVMGKGLGASLVMATVKAVVRAGSRTGDLVGALCLAADAIESDFETVESFVTVFHALLDQRGRVSYVDAGHGLSFVARPDGHVRRLATSGLPVGMFPEPDWYERSVELDVGDALVIVSDGLLDDYGHPDRLADALSAIVAGVPSRLRRASGTGQAATLVAELCAPLRRRSLDDDVTVVAAVRTQS